MNLPVAAESVLRWMLTYSLHSAVLGAAGLLAARIWLGPGSRRAVVLKVALFGALLSASLPWKAIAPLELRGQAGEAVADLSQGAERAGAPAAWAQLAGSRPIDSGLAERAVLSGALSGAPAAMTRPSTGLNRLGSSAPWWMAVIGGVSVLLVARMAFQRVRFLRSLRRSPLRDQASEALLASWSDEARTGAVALTASKNLRAPITLSSKEICVPQGCWDTLAGEERRALLAHEFAHIERKDPVWFTAAAALERVFFFLPWHRLVRERLNASAEIACDARAAERVGSAMSVARCLASVASWGAAAPALHRVPASIPAMAAGSGELVARVRHLLDEDERPVGRRFGAGAAMALVGFACCAPAVTTPQAADQMTDQMTDRRGAPSRFVGAIGIEVTKGGVANARRSSDYPAMEPIQSDLGTREGKEALHAWIERAAADLEPWSAEKLEEAGFGSVPSFPIHDGAMVIAGDDDIPLKYALWIMSMAGDRAVSMPDVRLRVGQTVYPVPLPVDIGLPDAGTRRALDVRLDPSNPVDPGQGVKYSVISTDRLAGMVPMEEELLEEEEDAPQVEPPKPKVSNSFEGFVASARSLVEEENIVEATVDGRKGIRMGQTVKVLDALLDLGVTRITFKGSYEN